MCWTLGEPAAGRMSRRTIKLVVFSVEGVLLRDDESLSPAAPGVFMRLKDAGVQATLISARPASGLLALARTLDVRGAIGAFNGGALVRAHGGVQFAHHLEPPVVQRALTFLDKARLETWLFAHGRWYARSDRGPAAAAGRMASGMDPIVVAQFAGLDRVDRIVGVSQDAAELSRLEPLVKQAVGMATVGRSQSCFLDITAPAANTAEGVSAIAAAARVPLSQVAVIGALPNALPMFARAGLSIAMGQAPDAVRRAADAVTGANLDDGLAEAIDRFVLRAVPPSPRPARRALFQAPPETARPVWS